MVQGETRFVRFAAGTIVGRRRKVNEDALCAIDAASVFVVADGSAHASSSGRFASDLVVEHFQRTFQHSGSEPDADALSRATLSAHRAIRDALKTDPGFGVSSVAALGVGLSRWSRCM